MKYILTLIATIGLGLVAASGATYKVSNAADVRKIEKRITAGDTILLRSGVWTDQKIVVNAFGTASAPVVIMAERDGETVLTGRSSLDFGGEWIVVRGLHFKDVTIEESSHIISFRTADSRPANNSQLIECAVTGEGIAPSMIESKWVSVYGTNNRVADCTFRDKANMGALLVIWPDEKNDIVPRHIIENNYFTRPRSNHDEKDEPINSQETIRIGTSQVSMKNGHCTVRNNFFESCNGEIEIISNKCCENVYEGNTFVGCVGTFTLRHGDRCRVEGNRFFGNGVKGTGGVRIIGFDHKVMHNYFEGLTGENYYSAISAVQGEVNSALSGYFAATNAEIAYNTIVNCTTGISINSRSSRQALPVERLHIHDNVVVADKESDVIVEVNPTPLPPVGLRWENNIFVGGSYKQTTAAEVGAGACDTKCGISWEL